ncbi:MAG: bacillithiol biosynthesis deacetylase BshB2 [Candidatus Cohnella colombiensis]|uniref:Bacillithiol biosynthesis deacetylase BshB2 n=1 Tax=Candidatus Cohnella colombiensis TaxID=3121368 RepID=A0AA95JFA3_9BACL|nr:MAG: bacillithiol biosynthesis deacetylase BshB2 [Cohnella sp.]
MNKKYEKILVVFPHPDDEAFGVSGTLAKYIHEGAQVTYACLTLGEMGRNMGFPPFANRVTLPLIRKLELEASCRAIGIQDVRMLGFHDKTIEFEDPDHLDAQLDALIREIEPSLVITFYPGYSVHPDHDATGAAVVRTISKIAREKRPVIQCVAFSNDREQAIGKPDIVNDISKFLAQKLASLEAHESQFKVSELLGTQKVNDKEIVSRFGVEQLWTYSFID